MCSFSPCGKYIAAGTLTAEISVWEVRSGDVIKGETKASEAHKITSIEWNPANNGEFAYADKSGQLGTIIDCYNVDENILENGIDENGSVNNDVDFGDSKLKAIKWTICGCQSISLHFFYS